jgi:hypothetical protein
LVVWHTVAETLQMYAEWFWAQAALHESWTELD